MLYGFLPAEHKSLPWALYETQARSNTCRIFPVSIERYLVTDSMDPELRKSPHDNGERLERRAFVADLQLKP